MRAQSIIWACLAAAAAGIVACGPKPHDSQEGEALQAPADAPASAPGAAGSASAGLPSGADPNAPSSGPPPPIAPTVAPPPPAPAETFAGDINLAGTEPFWSTEIRAGRITVKRPDHGDLAIPNPGPRITGDTAIWDGGGEGDHLTVVVEKAACNNGMSAKTYPFKASVRVGEAVLKGCAARAG